jgi:hypothetical protein
MVTQDGVTVHLERAVPGEPQARPARVRYICTDHGRPQLSRARDLQLLEEHTCARGHLFESLLCGSGSAAVRQCNHDCVFLATHSLRSRAQQVNFDAGPNPAGR